MASRLVTKTEREEVKNLTDIIRKHIDTNWTGRGFGRYIKKYPDPKDPMTTIIQLEPDGLRQIITTIDHVEAPIKEILESINEIARIGEYNPNISSSLTTGHDKETGHVYIKLRLTLSVTSCHAMTI